MVLFEGDHKGEAHEMDSLNEAAYFMALTAVTEALREEYLSNEPFNEIY